MFTTILHSTKALKWCHSSALVCLLLCIFAAFMWHDSEPQTYNYFISIRNPFIFFPSTQMSGKQAATWVSGKWMMYHKFIPQLKEFGESGTVWYSDSLWGTCRLYELCLSQTLSTIPQEGLTFLDLLGCTAGHFFPGTESPLYIEAYARGVSETTSSHGCGCAPQTASYLTNASNEECGETLECSWGSFSPFPMDHVFVRVYNSGCGTQRW